MASSSLLALIDDIATVLDDVAAMSKIAAKKTTGVLGDDLALRMPRRAVAERLILNEHCNIGPVHLGTYAKVDKTIMTMN